MVAARCWAAIPCYKTTRTSAITCPSMSIIMAITGLVSALRIRRDGLAWSPYCSSPGDASMAIWCRQLPHLEQFQPLPIGGYCTEFGLLSRMTMTHTDNSARL